MVRAQLDEAGYDYAIAVATCAEIEAGDACGQLNIIIENEDEDSEQTWFGRLERYGNVFSMHLQNGNW